MVDTIKCCSACKQELPISNFDRNGKYAYSLCKSCKRIRTAARRYNLTLEQVRELYNISACMVCGKKFQNQRMQHIHHTKQGVRGVVCQFCNHILAQETANDLERIEACLNFIQQPRKNLLDRVNPQGSLLDPSTTARAARFGEHICKTCKRVLPLTAFSENGHGGFRRTCKHCAVCSLQAKVYNLTFEEVYNLRLQTKCQCCGHSFTEKNFATIHHVKDRVFGLVCDACNRSLGQETHEQVRRLTCCAAWIKTMMIQSDLHGDMQRSAEMTGPAVKQ